MHAVSSQSNAVLVHHPGCTSKGQTPLPLPRCLLAVAGLGFRIGSGLARADLKRRGADLLPWGASHEGRGIKADLCCKTTVSWRWWCTNIHFRLYQVYKFRYGLVEPYLNAYIDSRSLCANSYPHLFLGWISIRLLPLVRYTLFNKYFTLQHLLTIGIIFLYQNTLSCALFISHSGRNDNIAWILFSFFFFFFPIPPHPRWNLYMNNLSTQSSFAVWLSTKVLCSLF